MRGDKFTQQKTHGNTGSAPNSTQKAPTTNLGTEPGTFSCHNVQYSLFLYMNRILQIWGTANIYTCIRMSCRRTDLGSVDWLNWFSFQTAHTRSLPSVLLLCCSSRFLLRIRNKECAFRRFLATAIAIQHGRSREWEKQHKTLYILHIIIIICVLVLVWILSLSAGIFSCMLCGLLFESGIIEDQCLTAKKAEDGGFSTQDLCQARALRNSSSPPAQDLRVT